MATGSPRNEIKSTLRGALMISRIGATFVLIAAVCITVAGQTGPTLTALNMPHYTGLERQARVQGIITLAFTLQGHSAEPTNVEVVSAEGSGLPLLKETALANVKTWRFENKEPLEGRYQT